MKKIFLLVFIMMLMSIICSCTVTRHTDYNHRYLDKLDSLSLQTDSSLSQLQIAVNRSVTSLQEWWLKREIEKTVTHYSPPDSTGKQYKTTEENYKETARIDQREVIKDSSSIQASYLEEKIWQLEERINRLQEEDESYKEEKETKKPPWERIILSLLVGLLTFLYFKRR